jgi:hypothetical protein
MKLNRDLLYQVREKYERYGVTSPTYLKYEVDST